MLNLAACLLPTPPNGDCRRCGYPEVPALFPAGGSKGGEKKSGG
jgi:hypothetical protein